MLPPDPVKIKDWMTQGAVCTHEPRCPHQGDPVQGVISEPPTRCSPPDPVQVKDFYDLGKVFVVVVVVVLTLTRIIKSVVTGQALVTLELRNTPGKNTHNPKKATPVGVSQ